MKKACVLLFLQCAYVLVLAQDTHYGTNQLGTRSALMGGAVVAGARDNSMLIYNPAAVAFIDSNSFSINANAYRAENTRIKNVLTEAKNFQSLQLNSVPILSSGQFKTALKDVRVSYGIFTPVAFQFRGLARVEGAYPVVGDSESPGAETFIGDQNLFSRLRELVFAVGASYKLDERWAIGITNMFNIRSQNYNRAIFSHYFLNDRAQTLVNTSFTQSFNYYNTRFTPKIGVQYRGHNWSCGATFTTPGISVLGSGSAGVDILGTNVAAGAQGRTTIVANSRQTGLKAKFKSPYSVAAGVQRGFGATHISLSASYFGRQGVYAIMKGEEIPFVRPQSAYGLINGDNLLRVLSGARPVLNVALGVEYAWSDRLSLVGSVRNNQSYYNKALLFEKGIKPDITTWDIYHLVGGVVMRRERSLMSLGLALSYGQDKNRIDQYLPVPSESNYFEPPAISTQATYTSVGLLIGYNYFFNKG